ncbi:hypothetical protein L292_1210 [Acinetobacter junii CIP 107470 = MTCC 11364]|uniref:Uncharacterized protein n=1 Tax=Acinetobacter junii CIP 107470 = MTCC 11364 TaxID=1217666 RepID=S7WHA1_ACIJU|nr:hypothetical protein L292_1210 [Acinetobacter junii CIP 107470 = MTCC 11364]
MGMVAVHCRIGSLEMLVISASTHRKVHCRIGSLEICELVLKVV